MSELYYYSEALKLGQKSARASSAKGQDPYLPALDEKLTVYTTIVVMGFKNRN